MAFTVPDQEPAVATGLTAGDWIQASSTEELLLRDRFLFATRRRLIASLPKVVTTASGAYQPFAGFKAITLPSSNGTLLFGFVASDAATVRLTITGSSANASTVTQGSIIGRLTGVPINTWFGVIVEVVSGTGAPVTISGIYIAEQILVAADLP
jgi:hypothetical protein